MLKNSIDENTKLFTDYVTDNICDGKRASAKPVYCEKFKKSINIVNIINFVENIIKLTN